MTEKRKLDDDYIENLIIKGMLEDSRYTAMLSSEFEKDYFYKEETKEI